MQATLPQSLTQAHLQHESQQGLFVYNTRITRHSDSGTWTFQLFGENIIKTTFHPTGYDRAENISNSVVLKPLPGNSVSLKDSDHLTALGHQAQVLQNGSGFCYRFGNKQKNICASFFSGDLFNGFRFKMVDDEIFFGGGERALPMNRRGFGFSLNNRPAFAYQEGTHDLNFSVPFLISNKGYGLFFDNPSNGYFDIGKKQQDIFEAGFSSGELNFYMINGRNVDEILRHYTDLVGRQPIPAKWVFGNLMSRFGYRSEEQLTEILARMKADDFPVDAVILDLFWFGDSIRNTMGNLDWINNKSWPDPAKMISKLLDEDIKTVLITEPYVVMGTKNYSESKKFHALDFKGDAYTLTNFYFGFGGLLDLFRKDARDWFWTKYKKQIEMGIAGWWGDLGEPETHPADIFHDLADLGFERKFKAEEVHNLYGHYWNMMVFEKYRQDFPKERLFNLNRSGFAGSQRYSIFPWSGDVMRNWSGYRAQLPIMLGMGLSGIPYIHADAGGFAMGEKDPELYTRWLQFAAFTPIFRPHGSALGELEPWTPSIESEPVFFPEEVKSIVRKYIKLRYSLLPYNYTLGYEQAKCGRPLARPMFFYDTSDKNVLAAEDQYMWGDQILVAPVLEKGATTRKLYLPKGCWYKFGTNIKVRGGQWINELVQLSEMPMYVKAGSFIPSYPGLMNTNTVPGALCITYYPDAENSSYTLYEDDGKTNGAFEQGDFELLHFKAAIEKERSTIKISSNGGEYAGKPSQRTINVSVPSLKRKPQFLSIDNARLEISTCMLKGADCTEAAVWDPSTCMLHVRLTFSNVPVVVSWQ